MGWDEDFFLQTSRQERRLKGGVRSFFFILLISPFCLFFFDFFFEIFMFFPIFLVFVLAFLFNFFLFFEI